MVMPQREPCPKCATGRVRFGQVVIGSTIRTLFSCAACEHHWSSMAYPLLTDTPTTPRPPEWDAVPVYSGAVPHQAPCPHCQVVGYIRHEHVITGKDAHKLFYCGACERQWTVADTSLSQPATTN